MVGHSRDQRHTAPDHAEQWMSSNGTQYYRDHGDSSRAFTRTAGPNTGEGEQQPTQPIRDHGQHIGYPSSTVANVGSLPSVAEDSSMRDVHDRPTMASQQTQDPQVIMSWRDEVPPRSGFRGTHVRDDITAFEFYFPRHPSHGRQGHQAPDIELSDHTSDEDNITAHGTSRARPVNNTSWANSSTANSGTANTSMAEQVLTRPQKRKKKRGDHN